MVGSQAVFSVSHSGNCLVNAKEGQALTVTEVCKLTQAGESRAERRLGPQLLWQLQD